MRYESKYEKYYGIDPFNPANTLKQHGILGMKWGVWNEETKARYLGTRRRKKSKADEPLRSKIGSKNKNDSKIMTDEEKRKRIDAKYVDLKTNKVKIEPLLNDCLYDDQFRKSVGDGMNDFINKSLNNIDLKYGGYLYSMLSDEGAFRVSDAFYSPKSFSYFYKVNDSKFIENLLGYWSSPGGQKLDKNNIKDIQSYLRHLVKYSESCDKIIDKKIEELGVSDSSKQIIKEKLRESFISPMWDMRFIPDRNTNGIKIGAKNDLINKIKGLFPNFNSSDEQPHLKRTHLTSELANISDDELNAAIKRMKLEQDYLNMLKNYPNASDKGKKYVDQFSDELFKNLSNGLGGAMGKKIAKAIDDLVNGDPDKKYDNEVRYKSNEALKAYNERKKLEEAYKGYRKKEDEK